MGDFRRRSSRLNTVIDDILSSLALDFAQCHGRTAQRVVLRRAAIAFDLARTRRPVRSNKGLGVIGTPLRSVP